MRRLRRSIRLIRRIISYKLRARRGIISEDRAVEELQSGDRLIVWDFMSGFVDASEGEVAVFARFTVLYAVNEEGRVACCGEFGGVGVVCGQGDCFTAEPVADVVAEKFMLVMEL